MERRTRNSLQRLVAIAWLVLFYGAATARADIHTSLQVRYHLDEPSGTSASDSSRNGRNGMLKNDATFVSSGRLGGAADLVGTNDEYIECPAITPATDGAQRLTVAFWVNTDSRSDNEILLSKFQDAANQFSIQFGTTGSGDEDDLIVLIGNGTDFGFVFTNSNVMSDNKWIHVTVVYDGTQTGNTNKCKVYINAIQVATGHGGTIPATLYSNSMDKWYIGWRDTQPSGQSLNGIVDEFHLYTRTLSVGDIQELYLQTDGAIIFNGGLPNPDSKLVNMTADVLAGSNEITICAWVNAAGLGEGNSGTVFRLDEQGNALVLYHHTSANTLALYTWFDGSSNGYWTFPVTDGVWQPIAITYDRSSDGTAPIVRVNFANVTVTPQGNPNGNPVAPNPGYCVGNASAGGAAWNGKITQVQVLNRILSPTETDACSKDPGSVKHALRLWLPMTSATDVSDCSGYGFDGTATSLETGSGPYFDTRFFFGVANETRGQIAIPSNGTEPAIEVRGVGTRTKLTPDGTLTGGARFVTTLGHTISQSTVVEPTVRDLYLFGNQGVQDQPWTNETGTDPVCHAIALDDDAPTVKNCKIFDFKGDAISIGNTTAEFSRMVRIPRVTNNKISHCWNGIVAGAVDAQVDGNRIAGVRYIGIRDTAGSIQCSNNHVFGADTAIQFEFGPSRSIGDRFSDAAYGFKIINTASGSHIADGTTEHCWVANIYAAAERIRIHNTRILVANTDTTNHPGFNFGGTSKITGLVISGEALQTLVSDCDIELGLYNFPGDVNLTGSRGVVVASDNVVIDNLKIIGSGRANEIGVEVAANRFGGQFLIDARGGGFAETGDRVVKFSSPGMSQTRGTGQVWYILYKDLDKPVEISANWGPGLKIFIRSNLETQWTELSPNNQYPPP